MPNHIYLDIKKNMVKIKYVTNCLCLSSMDHIPVEPIRNTETQSGRACGYPMDPWIIHFNNINSSMEAFIGLNE